MTAPLDMLKALTERQAALTHGELKLRPAATLSGLYACARGDRAGPVLGYILVEGKKVIAMVNFRPIEPIDGMAAYNIELAVPEDRRGAGRGQDAVAAALLELRHELARPGGTSFYVQAIVESDNPASMSIARQTISEDSEPTTDLYSGKPAFRYLRKLETKPATA